MRATKASDYSYKRFRICAAQERATTVSVPWLEYMALVRKFGSDARAFSRMLRATALHLKAVGYKGTFSAAVRKEVRLQLGLRA